jgi:hypothetical protein
MAIYHATAKVISRGSPRSTLAVTAYNNRDKAKDETTGLIYDFSKKTDLVYSEVLLCANAPVEYLDRETLWNAVERVENGNGQTARTFEISLPRELNLSEHIKLVQDYVRDNFVKDGMCADVAIHDKNDGNPHAHIMLTMRPINSRGEWEHKSTKVYLCKNKLGEEKAFTAKEWQGVKNEWAKQLPYFKDGNKKNKKIYLSEFEARDEKYSDYKRVKGVNDPKNINELRNPVLEQWNSEETFLKWREDWAVKVNAKLEKKSLPDRIDHRSYEAQGIDKIPTIHMGATASHFERNGIRTDKGDINRDVRERNGLIEVLKAELAEITAEINLLPAEDKNTLAAAVPTVINLEQIALELERYRREYIAVLMKIEENAKAVGSTKNFGVYREQASRIKLLVSTVQGIDSTIKKAVHDKAKLRFYQIRAKKNLQAKIDDEKAKKAEWVQELKSLGVSDISKANRVITKLNTQADNEQRQTAAYQSETGRLQSRKAEIQWKYKQLKNSLSMGQRTVIDAVQAAHRDADGRSRFGFAYLKAEVQARNDLEPSVNQKSMRKTRGNRENDYLS